MQHSNGQPVRSHLDRYNHGPRGRRGSTRRGLRTVFRDRVKDTQWVRTHVAPERTPGVRAARHRIRSLDDMNVLRDCGERAGLSDIDGSRQDGDPKAGVLSRRALLAGVLMAGLSPVDGQAIADEDGTSGAQSDEFVNALTDGVATDGFDVVACFDGTPARGLASYSVDYKGTSWLFSSSDNAAAFKADPGAYEPRYNGWCAYAVSEGYGAEVDFVNDWSVLEGKLYLNWDADTRDAFLSEQSTRIGRAEQNWPGLHAALLEGSVAMYTHAGEGVAIVHPQQID